MKLPHDLETERAVLGAMLLEQDAGQEGLASLKASDFLSEKNAAIFSAMQEVAEKGLSVDLITVFPIAKRLGIEPMELTLLTDRVAGTSNFAHWAGVLIAYSKKRQVFQSLKRGESKALSMESDAYSDINELQQELSEIATVKGVKESQTLEELAIEHSERTEKIASGDIESVFKTGLRGLDSLQVWQPGDFIIWAGRPSMGKTASALQVAKNMSETGRRVAFFSLEMSSLQLVNRLVANEGEIHLEKVLKVKYDQIDSQKYVSALGALAKLPLYIDDQSGINTVQLKNKLRKMELKHGKLDIVFIDYLQLMSSVKESGFTNRNAEIGKISRTLKGIAKELNIILVALAQLSRAVETRGGDKRPIMSDLRDSGEIEQDADSIIFNYRPEYYGIEQNEHGEPTLGLLELIVAKNRNGALGIAQQFCQLQYQKIGNY
jgi:replicative DNA helicase